MCGRLSAALFLPIPPHACVHMRAHMQTSVYVFVRLRCAYLLRVYTYVCVSVCIPLPFLSISL